MSWGWKEEKGKNSIYVLGSNLPTAHVNTAFLGCGMELKNNPFQSSPQNRGLPEMPLLVTFPRPL